jgi:hypothetical protein
VGNHQRSTYVTVQRFCHPKWSGKVSSSQPVEGKYNRDDPSEGEPEQESLPGSSFRMGGGSMGLGEKRRQG